MGVAAQKVNQNLPNSGVAMPLQTWIKAHPMQGKTIATYNTDGGGGTMHTSEDFEALLKGNKLLPHFTIFGTTDDKTPAVSKWLKGIGLLNTRVWQNLVNKKLSTL